MTIYRTLLEQLWSGDNPFNYIDPVEADTGYPHTNIQDFVIDYVATMVKPQFWLELGSMTGGSLIRTAQRFDALNLTTSLVCVDPFCGDVNMWAWEKGLRERNEWQFLRLQRGQPTIYDRFRANVRRAGFADRILPIVCTSLVGMKLIRRLFDEKRLAALPDVIYLDSAHEPDETLLELKMAWSLLNPGGILFGDDWAWDAVRNDVERFSTSINPDPIAVEHALLSLNDASRDANNVVTCQGQWLLMKPNTPN